MSTAAKQTTGGAAPGRRQRRDRPTSGAATGQGARRKKGTAPALPAFPCPSAAHCGVAPQAGVLRCWALVCAWAGTGVPDGRASGRADGCLCACHASPTPGSRESLWNSSRRCRLLCCVASGWVSRCEAVGEMARGLRQAGELLAATICASLRAAQGPRVCGAIGARPRSRFTVDLSGGFGREPAQKLYRALRYATTVRAVSSI